MISTYKDRLQRIDEKAMDKHTWIGYEKIWISTYLYSYRKIGYFYRGNSER